MTKCRLIHDGWGRRRLEASIAILDADVSVEDAWNALQSCVSTVGTRMPWIERWDVDESGQIDATILVSRTLHIRADVHLKVDAQFEERVIRVRTERSPRWLSFNLECFVSSHREVRLFVEVQVVPILPTPMLDAKLQGVGEQFAAAIDACLRARVVVSDGLDDEVVIGHDEENRTLISHTFYVPCSLQKMWHVFSLFPLLAARLTFVTDIKTREVSKNENILHIQACLSKTLGMVVHCQLQVTLDDQAHVMHVRTLSSSWGTYDATLQISDNGLGGVKMSYSSIFTGTTVAGFRVPFVDGKLRDFTARLVHMIQSSFMKTSWREEFMNTFEELVVSPIVNGSEFKHVMQFDDTREHTERMLRYTVQGGKAYRALLVRLAAEGVRGAPFDHERDAEALRKAHVLGWTTELAQSFALIADDIMDGSSTRRGKPCWYLAPDVGTPCAINDSLLTFSMMNHLLKRHFQGALFEKISRLVFDTALQTCFGQMLDTFSERVSTKSATYTRYNAIVLLKTTYYTIYDPIAKGILLCELPDSIECALLKNAWDVSVQIGQLFQEQDDYLDCYGDPNVTGKVGTDIVDNKCTWLIAYALDRANEEQHGELVHLYGTGEDISRVKEIFTELDVHAEYRRRQAVAVNECIAITDRQLRSTVVSILAELMYRKS